MSTTVDGIVSGIDTTALINAILTAQSLSVNTLKDRVGVFEKQKNAVSTLKGHLSTLSEKIRSLSKPEDLLAYKAETSAKQFAVTAGAGAIPGSYAIQVDHLATAGVSESQGFADPAAYTLATGNLAVTVGGTTTNVPINGTNNSLTGLAAALDDLDGIAAYVVNTGVGPDPYKLVVQGQEPGLANAFSLDTSGLGGGTVPTFTERTAAADAELTVAGVSIHSSSNTLRDVIPGLTIDLLATGTAPELVTVHEDLDTMRERVKGIVDAYNEAVTYFNTQRVYNAEAGIKGGLFGEGTSRRAMSDLSEQITNQFTVAGVSLTSLAEIGISTGSDGKLKFDEADFDDAMGADMAGVVDFLTSEDGPLASIADRIDDLYVDSDNGSLVAREKSLGSSIEDLNEQIATAEERIDSYATLLRNQFTAMEVALGKLQTTQGFLSSLFASASASSSSSNG